MKSVISDLVERLALPPEGIDLRAELVALQRSRMRQALAQSGGDYGRAARLLRMRRVELVRLEATLAGDDEPAAPAREVASVVDARTIPRFAGGVELISAKAIRRYAAEGLAERSIASRLGCNPFIVEKVLREQTAAEIVRLDRDERLAPKAIAAKLQIPIARVRGVLMAHDLGKLALRASERAE